MNWTPEALKAEMDYRVERALQEADVEAARRHLREEHPAWWRRLRTQHRHDSYNSNGNHSDGGRAA